MVVCFIGHRKIENTEQLKFNLTAVVSQLIKDGAKIFLFGSRSEFDSLCWDVVSELRAYYPKIKRVYVRAMYPIIQKYYEDYLLEYYEETYFPQGMENAGRSSYIKRNQNMIDTSDVCVFYYNSAYKLPSKKQKSFMPLPDRERKSGTKIAYEYALKKKKEIINIYK